MNPNPTMTTIRRAYKQIVNEPMPKVQDSKEALRRLQKAARSRGRRISFVEGEPIVLAPRESGFLGRSLRLLEVENPKRPGTRTHARYELYRECSTSDEFLRKCQEHSLGTRREVLSDLSWDSTHGYIRLR